MRGVREVGPAVKERRQREGWYEVRMGLVAGRAGRDGVACSPARAVTRRR